MCCAYFVFLGRKSFYCVSNPLRLWDNIYVIDPSILSMKFNLLTILTRVEIKLRQATGPSYKKNISMTVIGNIVYADKSMGYCDVHDEIRRC